MIHSLSFFVALHVAVLLAPTAAEPRTMAVDTASSTLVWNASKVAGSHTGLVTIASGSLALEKGLLRTAEVTMDMTSITCTDVTNPSSNAKLVAHLKNADFFDVEEHPTAAFRTTFVELTSSREDLGTYRVTGVLKIKGVEKQNTFDVGFRKEKGGFRAAGTIRFDRTHFGIQYRSGSIFDGLGDRMIKDEVELVFDITAR